MNPDQLARLKISPEARRRRRHTVQYLFALIAAVTGLAAFFAWPRKEGQRTMGTLPPTPAPLSSPTPSAATAPPAPPQAGRPATGAPAILTTSGYIVPRERIEVSPRFLGTVRWLGVKKGDAVKTGDVLVLLDDAEQKARVAEADGRLAAAEKSMELARRKYERTRKLSDTRVATAEEEEDARLQTEIAAARVAEARGALDTARTYLEWTVIRSPVDGVVLEKLVDANELVSPQSFGGERGPSTALVALADLKDLQVEIDLNESDVAKIGLRQECRVIPEAYPDRVYGGYVAEIAPEASRQKGTLQIKVQIRDPDRFLTPQLNAKVEFLAGE